MPLMGPGKKLSISIAWRKWRMMANAFTKLFVFIMSAILVQFAHADLVAPNKTGDLKIGDLAPGFSLKTHEGKDFNLQSRRGQWTVLYFYPKAGTPGCTKN